MAINIDVFKTRTLTAFIFVVVMLAGVLWNFWSFLFLFTLIHIGCWVEFIQLKKKIYGNKNIGYILFGLLYISLPVLLLLDLSTLSKIATVDNYAQSSYSFLLPCSIFFSLWINDTMAYIVGSLIGKTPFSKISPKKTWEGTAGGMVLCIVTIALMGFYIPVAKVLDVKHWIAIAAICAVFGTAGDLFESKLKRMADVKDSGSIMPGHGGFLDRFDSLLVATPFVWLYIKLFV